MHGQGSSERFFAAMSLRPTSGRAFMLRVRWGMTTVPLGVFLAASGAIFAAATSTLAIEPSYSSRSTLDPQVPPQQWHLDATIASMVRRGVIVDVSTPLSSKPLSSFPDQIWWLLQRHSKLFARIKGPHGELTPRRLASPPKPAKPT